ncbi:atp4 subunit B of the stator stalk of mitochondrial F1F0 ATP synthase [Malassezia japonica]|uniref:ATP synthase subunit 4 n=1 Tax=Malassezia japonica TaxID=223818 RepID=A0AAF0JCK2_9BASI|nr:atp4 subunit B of the stator stalk of mitochondrial F1F0 ATP synthase [Malassezia japonica]WFD41309.1 atp4 subunit B of the stator stalk of mitochondrial F1F0 ATP synthase [Malassezia japonica]
MPAVAAPARFYSDKPSPEAKASSLIDALPGNSLVSKTTWVTLGAGLTAFTVSNELYVANDETVILAGFLIFATLVGRSVVQPYQDWANSTIDKIAGILNEARAGHTKAVQNRIDQVSQKSDVVDVTKGLYAIAKETIQAEKDAYELKQRTAIAAEVKQVLDSWVRYEAQQREAEQNLLTETVIRKVTESLADDKVQKQILESAVADVEKLVKDKKI